MLLHFKLEPQFQTRYTLVRVSWCTGASVTVAALRASMQLFWIERRIQA
jgi:hypothetical protein